MLINKVIYPVKDVEAAKTYYTELLGVEPYVDQPYYVGFRVGDQEIGLDPNGHRTGLTGPVGYRDVDDIEAAVRGIIDAGGQVRQEPRDVGGGMLIAQVTDADGNITGLSSVPRG